MGLITSKDVCNYTQNIKIDGGFPENLLAISVHIHCFCAYMYFSCVHEHEYVLTIGSHE